MLLVANAGGLRPGVEACAIGPFGCEVVEEEGTRPVDFFAGPATKKDTYAVEYGCKLALENTPSNTHRL